MAGTTNVDIKSALRKSSFFGKANEDLLSKLIGMAVRRSYQKGDMIFAEGDPCIGMFIVADGAVKVFKIGTDGREHVLHVAEYGETFAEAAIFMEDSGYPAYAAAIRNTSVIIIPKDRLLDLLGKEPKLAIQVLESLAVWTHRLIVKLEYITLKDASSRLAEYIRDRVGDSDMDEFDLSIPKQTLAAQLAISSETLSRILTHFEAEGIIESNGRHISILDRDALTEISQEGASGTY